MRNRKTVIVAFLLVAVMLLAVGYAALNDKLTITGNIGAITDVAEDTFDGDIYFSDKIINRDDTNKATCVIETNGNTATITADQFTVSGQEVHVVLTIKNDSTEFNGNVTVDVNTLDSAHPGVFSATCEWYEGGVGTGNLNTMVINGNGGTAQVLVTIKLNETPVEAHTATYTVKFNVESVDMGI